MREAVDPVSARNKANVRPYAGPEMGVPRGAAAQKKANSGGARAVGLLRKQTQFGRHGHIASNKPNPPHVHWKWCRLGGGKVPLAA